MLSKLRALRCARRAMNARAGVLGAAGAAAKPLSVTTAAAAAHAPRRLYWTPPTNHHVKALTNAHPHSQHLPAAYMMSSNVVVDRAQGTYVWGKDGKKYIDFQSGIGVTSIGHCHPAIVKATTAQINTVIHAQMNCIQHPTMLELTEKLTRHTSKLFSAARGPVQYHFSNSGAEGIENAVKLARQATGKGNIIVFQGGFHGRTLGTGALTTAKTFYRAANNPLPGGTYVAQYPYCMRCPTACACASKGVNAFSRESCCGNPIQQVKYLLKQQTAPADTAAVLVEPVLGEGGYVVPPAGFFQELRKVCDENGLILIADEVQSGFGRTGKMFAIEHWAGAEPDILVMAKGIAGGMPLSGIAAPKSVFDRTHSGSVGGTYGGNAVACAAANAVLDTFEQENVLANVNTRSKQWFTLMQAIAKKFPGLVYDIRGLGLMTAVEFDTTGKYRAGVAGAIQQQCLKNGLLILTTGIYDTLRFIPPLNVSESDMSAAMTIVEKSIGEVVAKY